MEANDCSSSEKPFYIRRKITLHQKIQNLVAGTILTSDLPCAELDDDHGVSQMNSKYQRFFWTTKKIGLLMVTSILLASVSLLFITFSTGVLYQGNTSLSKRNMYISITLIYKTQNIT